MKRTICLAFTMLLLTLSNALAASAPDNSKEWRSYIKLLEPIGERVAKLLPEPQNPQLRQEMHRQLYSLMAAGYWSLLYENADNPDFIPFFYNYGAPNPDDLYRRTRIDGSGVYRISGFRGTTRIVTFSIGSGAFFVRGEGEHWGPNLAEYDLDTINIEKDGSFEVILSPTRPEGYTGNWWQLDPAANNILVRQRHYDWVNEQAGALAIERLDRPASKQRQSAEALAANMRQVAQWTESWARWTIEFSNKLRREGLINKVGVDGLYATGGYKIQKYYQGLWDIQPDEALILETEIPSSCRYWAVQLVDELYAALDLMNLSRQTNLNGHSARLDADGKFRAVISSQDPGVPNWLDTAGYQRGAIFGRWLGCDSTPTPTIRKVKVAEVRQYLPPDTPVVSAEAREETVRKIRRALQMRRRW